LPHNIKIFKVIGSTVNQRAINPRKIIKGNNTTLHEKMEKMNMGQNAKPKKVMVFGTFDILHKGHMHFLGQAKRYGILIVVVARSCNVARLKGRLPLDNEKKRLANIKRLGIARKSILGDKKDLFKIIRKEKPDIICLGYDQKSLGVGQELRKLGLKTRVIRLRPYKPERFKSTKLRQKLGLA
jgi:FAD synthetase